MRKKQNEFVCLICHKTKPFYNFIRDHRIKNKVCLDCEENGFNTESRLTDSEVKDIAGIEFLQFLNGLKGE